MGKNLFNLCSRAGIAPVNFSKIHGRMPVGGKFTVLLKIHTGEKFTAADRRPVWFPGSLAAGLVG